MPRKASFRFMVLESTDSARIVTQDARRRRSIITGDVRVHGAHDHLRKLAKLDGCTIIIRPKRSNG